MAGFRWRRRWRQGAEKLKRTTRGAGRFVSSRGTLSLLGDALAHVVVDFRVPGLLVALARGLVVHVGEVEVGAHAAEALVAGHGAEAVVPLALLDAEGRRLVLARVVGRARRRRRCK